MQMTQPHIPTILRMYIKLLEENIDKLFDWFWDNFLKANPDTRHLLTNIDEDIKSNKQV